MEYFKNCGLDYPETCPLVPTKKQLQPLTFHPPLAQSLKLVPEHSNHFDFDRYTFGPGRSVL